MNLFRFFILLISMNLCAQDGFRIGNGHTTVIDFKFVNNLIVLPLKLNGIDMHFILDTGVNQTLFFSSKNHEFKFIMDGEKSELGGFGDKEKIEGLKSTDNVIHIGNDFIDTKHTVYIIIGNSFDISRNLGFPVSGIIGYEFFKNHLVEIDYQKQKIKIQEHNKASQKRLEASSALDISLERNKPYLNGNIGYKGVSEHAKLLVDTGNSDALWLFSSKAKQFVRNNPNFEDYLGVGFNGDIFGKRTRINDFSFGKYKFIGPIVALPNSENIQFDMDKDRTGLIGNEILRRFKVVFDYSNRKLYLKRNKSYSDLFLVDKSGLAFQHSSILHNGRFVNIDELNELDLVGKYSLVMYEYELASEYSVSSCNTSSPCERAGLKKGDILISINDEKIKNKSLQEINNFFGKGVEGQTIKLEMKREDEVYTTELILKDPIPYIDK